MGEQEGLEGHPSIVKRTLRVQNVENCDEVDVVHYQYTHWPDKGVPRSSKEVLALVRILELDGSAYKLEKEEWGPPIVMCNSGNSSERSIRVEHCNDPFHAFCCQ